MKEIIEKFPREMTFTVYDGKGFQLKGGCNGWKLDENGLFMALWGDIPIGVFKDWIAFCFSEVDQK